MKKTILAGVACLLFPGCQTFDKTLDSADRALSVTKTPTAKTITDIAKSDNREAVLREGLKRRAEIYERDPQVAISDLRGLRRDYDNLVAALTGNVNRNWGKSISMPARSPWKRWTTRIRRAASRMRSLPRC
jgi:hypothetical protein